MTVSRQAYAWVESPLQLLCAVEYAAVSCVPVRIVPRAGAVQLTATAERLRSLGLPSGVTITGPSRIPHAPADHWVVGDAFSGVVHSLLALRMPRLLTIVDDGSYSLRLPAVLDGRSSLSRSAQGRSTQSRSTQSRSTQSRSTQGRSTQSRSALVRSTPARAASAGALAQWAAHRVRALDSTGHLELFSLYELDHPARMTNRFGWLTGRSRRGGVATGAVVLGSASVTDGLLPESAYLDWVSRQPRGARYLPHRRETRELIAAVAALGLTVVETGLPVELVLAGGRNLTVSSLASTAVDTLRILLAGSGSTVSVDDTMARAA